MFQLVYVSFKLVFGTLYPAYCSFKAVKTKNVKVSIVHIIEFFIEQHSSYLGVCTLDDLLDSVCTHHIDRRGDRPVPQLLVPPLL